MIAFQKNLIATADAHELMAEFGETGGGISGAEQGEDGGRQQEGLESFATKHACP
jgi:hypothetical protein